MGGRDWSPPFFTDEDPAMAMKPNYSFERRERERLQAIKAAEKAEAKRRQREADKAEAAGSDGERQDPTSES